MTQRLEHDRLFIGGEWVEPAGTGVIEVVSPHSEQPVGRVPEGTEADVDWQDVATGLDVKMTIARRIKGAFPYRLQVTGTLRSTVPEFVSGFGAGVGFGFGTLSGVTLLGFAIVRVKRGILARRSESGRIPGEHAKREVTG